MARWLNVLLFFIAISSDTYSAPSDRAIDFTISIPLDTVYVAGDAIPIRCVFTNTGNLDASFRIPIRDSSDYAKAPGFLLARVWDIDGRLLTTNDVHPDGWWSIRTLDSTAYLESEGDRITISPGGVHEIEVDLSIILRGCRLIKGILSAGRYRVQLDSEAGKSNKLSIELIDAEPPNKSMNLSMRNRNSGRPASRSIIIHSRIAGYRQR